MACPYTATNTNTFPPSLSQPNPARKQKGSMSPSYYITLCYAQSSCCITPVPLALFFMLAEELKRGFSMQVIKGKASTPCISEAHLNYLRDPFKHLGLPVFP